MSALFALGLLLAAGAGVVLGMLGGGGSILILPLLVELYRIEPRAAIASSLWVVGCTSALGVLRHARSGRVRYRLSAAFGLAAMLGAACGAQLAQHLPSAWLLAGFAVVMLLAARKMLWTAKRPAAPVSAPKLAKSAALGLLTGVLSGLVGAGGGFLIVPVLTLSLGLPMREATATSMAILALQSLTGALSHAQHVALDWSLLGSVTLACALGMLLGSALAEKVQTARLRQAFAYLVWGMGLWMLGRALSVWLALAAGLLFWGVLWRTQQKERIKA